MGRKKKAPSGRSAAQAANNQRRRRRRTGKKTIHYILLVLFLLSAGSVLSLTTFFKIEAVYVAGTDKYPEAELVAASGIQVGENLLRVSQARVEQELKEQYPYIASVEIRRKLPPAVEIQIIQEEPDAAVLVRDEVVLITGEGKVLERSRRLIPPEIPVVQGIDVGKAQAGDYLGEEAKSGLVMLQYLLEAAEEVGFGNITNVDIRDQHNMLIIYENRLLLKMGTESDLDHKLLFIKRVLQDLEPDQEGRIDVSDAKTKGWLIVKDITLQEAVALEADRLERKKNLPDLLEEDEQLLEEEGQMA